MSTQLAAARRARGWTQAQVLHAVRTLAREAGQELPEPSTLRVMLSRWENGRHEPDARYQRLLADAFELSEGDLGFSDDAPQNARPLMPMGPELIRYLDAVLNEHVRADRLIGSSHLAGVVDEQLKTIELCVRDAPTPTRAEYLRLANRYAEFSGWLYQDQGRYADAEVSTRKALDFAQALGDDDLISYTLMRRSNIATEAGRASDALTLAQAALQPADLPSGLRAVAHRQEAAAHAILGDDQEYHRAVAEGLYCANEAEEESELTLYCTVPYMRMEAGASAMHLGRPDLALGLLDEARQEWPEGHPRDGALCLARLAEAHAAAGNPDQACPVAQQATEALLAAPSQRTAATLRVLGRKLAPYRARQDVIDLRDHLHEILP